LIYWYIWFIETASQRVNYELWYPLPSRPHPFPPVPTPLFPSLGCPMWYFCHVERDRAWYIGTSYPHTSSSLYHNTGHKQYTQ
jgi:hypothetical protein